MIESRRAGVLLHPTSFPGPNGIGELGPQAFRVIDKIAEAGLSLWQVLPLGPTGYGDSPYACFSAFAGNHLLISMDVLEEKGWLEPGAAAPLRDLPAERVDYGALIPLKNKLLGQAYDHWKRNADSEENRRFDSFRKQNAAWLNDYTLFISLKRHFRGKAWNEWPAGLRDRRPEALSEAGDAHTQRIERQAWFQYIVFEQWHALKDYANGREILVIGDMPIFVAYDSVDVWANRDLFHLDAEGNPTVVAGVPPDYFSDTGQLWGNPLYDWQRHEEDGFGWWIARVKAALEAVDILRIDHFRGFDSYWEVPAGETTAMKGRWVDNHSGPRFFETLREHLGELLLIAENLGDLSYGDTEGLRKRLGLPGMCILQFAFGGGPDNYYLPHNHYRNSVVYTGTHDNLPTNGWWEERAGEKVRDHFRKYTGGMPGEAHEILLRLAFSSVAAYAVAPVQDLLGLGADAAMNRPGKADANWNWRMTEEMLEPGIARRIKDELHLYGRIFEKPGEKRK